MIRIKITVTGETASGKSLAIADMIAGLQNSFYVRRGLAGNEIGCLSSGEEYIEFDARLKCQGKGDL